MTSWEYGENTVQGIIAILGPTGVGKSTQVGLLAREFRKKGYKVTTTQLRINHLFADAFIRIMARILVKQRNDVLPIGALYEEKPSFLKKTFIFWMMLDILSIAGKFLVHIYIPRKIGRLVIVEDYIPTTIADHIFLCRGLGLPREGYKFFKNYMTALMHLAGPFQSVILDAKFSESEKRRKGRGRWNELPEYVHIQSPLLFEMSNDLAKGDNLYIDTTLKSVEEVRDIIIKHLTEELMHQSTILVEKTY
ncbi:MAG: hypothetical protein ACFFDN_26050 [Candidatus Hodarchaeota archaeon]